MSEMSPGSEAMSRFEMFVPTAYVVPQESTAVVEAVVAPSAENARPSAPSATELLSSENSFARQAEEFELGESASGGDQPQVPSSPAGTYSMYSRGFSLGEGSDGYYDDGRGNRYVGTREWGRNQQQESSARMTESAGGDGDEENTWTGYADEASGIRRGGGEGRAQDPVAGELPPFPYQHENSSRSFMSHDLSGFSDFDPIPKGSGHREMPRDGGASAPPLVIAGTGAGAAAAADAANAAASKTVKGNAKTDARGSNKKRPFLAPRLPLSPDATVRDGGETKQEGGENYSTTGTLKPPDDDGTQLPIQDDPQIPLHVSPAGALGEYAVIQYRSVVFTPVMFMVCGILLAYEFSLNEWEAEPWAENPSWGPSVEILIEAGAKRTDLIVDNGDWWRLISPMFLHAGVVHFLFNMLGFLQVGTMVERVFGWWRVALIYLVAGIFGTIVSAIFVPLQVMVGASGAIFGVFGALWADLWQNWSVYSEKCWALTVLLFLTALNVVLGLMPFLDNFAHIGGIIMGFFMGLGLLVQKREDSFGSRLETKCYQQTLQLVSAVAVPTLLILGLSLLYGRSDPNEWCGWCEKISCVEFPPGNNPWWTCDECTSIGFEATYFENGTTVFTCPDLSTVYTESCAGLTVVELTDCCNDVCL